MAVQLLPLIKAVTPYIAQVATVAIPAFTSKGRKEKPDDTTTQQIEELQQAATQNAESMQLLADNLQQVIKSLEKATEEAEKQVKFYKILVLGSVGIAIISLALSAYLFINL